MSSTDPATPLNFIEEAVERDLADGKHGGRVTTRFPPEPNGFLHIGHAKAICVNFGLAQQYGGQCSLRFDDTNPSTEDSSYVRAIMQDIRWLGFDWGEQELYASDYFEQLYQMAEGLIRKGKAYVDSLSAEEISAYRGDYTTPGRPSPFRDRSVEENLDLFQRMQAGEFPEGAHALRAKIEVQAKNMQLRDPVIFRIRADPHHRTGQRWHVYPTYDMAHGQSDAIEGVTHSLCSLEFVEHRPLYDWLVEQIGFEDPPKQYEFARLNLSYTVLSKRKLLQLVQEGLVEGWDDPRMPTLSAMRRRGYPPAAIRAFCDRVGVAKRNGIVDVSLLENALRTELNRVTPRMMAVLRPLKLVIVNYPEDQEEVFDCPLHPEDPSYGTRPVPFCRELWVERDDFREQPPRKWFRLAPGREVRLRYACLLTCVDVVKDPDTGEVTELRCEWDPDSRGGRSPDGRRVRGTLHWVSAHHAIEAEVRLYDRLFMEYNPLDRAHAKDFKEFLNPDALQVLQGCKLEPSLAGTEPGASVQLERLGYFCADPVTSQPGAPVFNRTISLRDSWRRLEKQQEQQRLAKNKPKKNKRKKKKKKQQQRRNEA